MSVGSRLLLGAGWVTLWGGLACVLVAYGRLAREPAVRLEDGGTAVAAGRGLATAARWLLVAGLALTGAGLLAHLG